MTYQVPQNIDNNKIFLVNRSEIEGRLESAFYKPSIACLENKIRSLSTKKIKNYAISLAGGATPKKSGEENYYSDSKNGIPFLRVQNLQTTGELSLDGCIFINEATHNGLLKRSQVSEGDLLIKMTGVGRMAIASVAPNGFIGNTNQHMVVVKTGDANISKYLAHYLNLDIVERIASRHSTGGTRPALDYPSLRDIPVIEGLDFSSIEEAIIAKKTKEKEAQQLLDSIDNYLLNELNIVISKVDKSLKSRVFYSSYKEIAGKRIDPKKYSTEVCNLVASIEASVYDKITLRSLVSEYCSGDWGVEDDGALHENYIRCLVLRGTEIDNRYNITVNPDKVKYRLIKSDKYLNMSVEENDIIVEKSGGSEDQPVGRVAIIDHNLLQTDNVAFSNFLMKIKVKGVNPCYLYYFLRTMYNIGITESMQSQTNGIRNLIVNEFLSQTVVVPSQRKQQEIVNHIQSIRYQAKTLQEQGNSILENAKREVEKMIIGRQ